MLKKAGYALELLGAAEIFLTGSLAVDTNEWDVVAAVVLGCITIQIGIQLRSYAKELAAKREAGMITRYRKEKSA